MKLQYQKGILAIGAHPDDIELGCGASLARLIAEGYYVIAVVMTAGTSGCNKDVDRHNESKMALSFLGCQQIVHLDFEDTRTSQQLDEMIKALEDVIKHRFPPQVRLIRAYTMHDNDRHQDHRAVHKASIVACRNIPQILGYETPSTWLTFIPQVFENVSEEKFTKKVQAISLHQSQQHRDYIQSERLRTVAQFRGQQAGCNLCEGFVVHKMIL
ncbi:PIG-L deacetylase family protein [Superficieibacter sp. 1612_C1]|uniref:PIG-L deacetylase family protein n=1 Tax=Superficieibacter sp. 1612_C1 TaxID=2780382 RepID=UPI00188371E4|nr:PIG-L deacetylase family protein [Superficieibacter sp. 1612_C1]